MKKEYLRPNRLSTLAICMVLVAALAIPYLSTRQASAAALTSRKLTLGSSVSNTSTSWTFQFSDPGTPTLKGIAFRVCEEAAGSCTTPNAWDNSTVSYTSLTYNGSTQAGWTLDNAGAGGAGYFGIKNNSASNATTDPIVASFSVTNPTTTNESFYVRIVTYSGNDFSTPVDDGVVAASTAEPIVLTGTMPESLVFCTGETVSETAGVPDCTTATAGTISFNDLFSTQATRYTSSMMAASTNASSGYVITVRGATMTSGGNTIGAIGGSAEAPILGKPGGQFGLNLKDNATPNIGAEVDDTPNGTNLRGQASAPFATADNYAFQANTTQQVAASDNGGAGGTDAQRFTVSYIVNVPGSQAAGTYTTTLTYICTPTF